jgi:hypothetical protein
VSVKECSWYEGRVRLILASKYNGSTVAYELLVTAQAGSGCTCAGRAARGAGTEEVGPRWKT